MSDSDKKTKPEKEEEEQWSTLEYYEQLRRQTMMNEKHAVVMEEQTAAISELPATIPVIPLAQSVHQVTPSEKTGAQGINPDQRHVPKINTNPPPAYILMDANGQQQPLYTIIDSASARSIHPQVGFVPLPERTPREQKIMGLRRSTFIAAAAGLGLFILGTIITGITLAVANAKASAAEASSKPTTESESAANLTTTTTKASIGPGIHVDSKIAALNWTDFSAVNHQAVFYQDSFNALMAMIIDSVSNEWRPVNLTALASDNGIDVLPGTPLAVTTNRGLWNLYYLTSSNQVAELYSTDPYTNWASGEFHNKIQGQAVAGSRLAAVQQQCTGCANALLVMWQEVSGVISMANFTNSVWTKSLTIADDATLGTGMAISTFMDFRGKLGPNLNALRMYYAAGPNFTEKMLGPETKFKLATGNFEEPISGGLTTAPSPEIASITYGKNGWDNNLVTYLTPNGGLVCHSWTGDMWTVQPPNLTNSPDGVGIFTSIAATQDMTISLRTNGTIHRYRTTEADPFGWVWESAIDVANVTGVA